MKRSRYTETQIFAILNKQTLGYRSMRFVVNTAYPTRAITTGNPKTVACRPPITSA